MNSYLQSGPIDLKALAARTEPLRFKPHQGPEQEFLPDASLGYFDFEVATGWPAGITIYGWGIHPQVVANSCASMRGKMIDREHRRQANNPTLDHDDFIGYVAAVSFPPTPPNGSVWKVTDKPPAIKGVAAFDKKAVGLKRMLGEHITGRHQWTVSMDADWILEQAGFAVQLPQNQKPEMDFTPPDFIQAGWEYIPPEHAPKDLVQTYSIDENKVTKNWKGRKVNVLLGGIAGQVHFCGFACVKYGAEGTAKMGKVTAAGPGHPLIEAMYDLPRQLNAVLAEIALRPKPPTS